jgi:hypothetical protein
MMHVHPENNGEIRRYSGTVIEKNIYDREFKLNVIHDTKTHMIDVYINNSKKMSVKDNGWPTEGFWYFKTGVYEQKGAS